MRHALLVLTILTAGAAGSGAAGPELSDVLGRASRYVAQVERALALVVVEERYTQSAEMNRNLGGSTMGVTGGGGVAIVEGDTVKTKRQSRSEVVWARRGEAPVTWSGVKRVLEVDGVATANAPGDLLRLATTRGDLDARWPALAAASRADQLDGLPREFHVAPSALALLREDQRDRITFRKDGEERLFGVTVWKVSYVEQRGPALWRSLGNVPLGTRGAFWIDPADGRVLRSRVEVGTGKTTEQSRVEVDYGPDSALGVLVPREMREKYESDAGKVTCKATFSGLRVIGGQ